LKRPARLAPRLRPDASESQAARWKTADLTSTDTEMLVAIRFSNYKSGGRSGGERAGRQHS